MTYIDVILKSLGYHSSPMFFLSFYIYFLNVETQILELKKKQENQVQLLKQKEKSEEAAKRLQAEIQYIKAQKVC